MFYHKPIPIFEANFFLADLAQSFPDRNVIKKQIICGGEAGKELSKYYDILVELQTRLESSVEADRADIDALYQPISKQGSENVQVEASFLANCFALMNSGAFDCLDDEESFKIIRDGAQALPCGIYNMIKEGEEFITADDSPSLLEIIRLIKDSDYSPSSKLTLIDAAMEPEKYAEKLINLLAPVAAEFRKCEKLYVPLLEQYEETIGQLKSEKDVIGYFFHNTFENMKDYSVFPLILLPIKCVVGVNHPINDEAKCYLGSLAYFARQKFLFSTATTEVTKIMEALANKNRIRIIEELAGGRKFGRELADKLHLTTGSISQNISLLTSAGLVQMESVGTRMYYAIDYKGVERFLNLINQLFYAKDK